MTNEQREFPKCRTCAFFSESNQQARCNRYDFVMPELGWNTVCHDWQTETQTIDLSQLKPRVLYYYSQKSPDILYSELAPFQELKHPLISVSIRKDQDLGWIIFPRKQYEYFPSPGELINITIGDRKSKFEVINEERKLAFELISTKQHTWESQYHMQQVFMLSSVESKTLLFDWYDEIIDVHDYASKEVFRPSAGTTDATSKASLHAFLEIVSPGREYRLIADLLNYQKYIR